MKSAAVLDRTKSPSTASFTAVKIKPVTSGENFGAELAGTIDKNELLRVLRIFFQNKLITSMAISEGLNGKCFIIYKVKLPSAML